MNFSICHESQFNNKFEKTPAQSQMPQKYRQLAFFALTLWTSQETDFNSLRNYHHIQAFPQSQFNLYYFNFYTPKNVYQNNSIPQLFNQQIKFKTIRYLFLFKIELKKLKFLNKNIKKIQNINNNTYKSFLMKATILFMFLLALTFSLYDSDSPVYKLTQSNFRQLVLQSDEFWLVQFYAPWCGHCKKAAPEYQQAAEILKGIVNLGAVDMTTDQAAGSSYGISGYPTIKLFGADKSKPIDFSSGDRTFQKFVDYCMQNMKKQISERTKKLKTDDDETL